MDLNATLLGQVITFAIFVWFTIKFVWPQLEAALQQRRKVIADGLAAAEKGQQDLQASGQVIKTELAKAREQANNIIELANKQATAIIEQARADASQESSNIIASGQKHLQQEIVHAKAQLQNQLATLVISSAAKLLARDIKAQDHQELLSKMMVIE